VVGYLWRITGDEQAACDLTQETFLRAWQRFLTAALILTPCSHRVVRSGWSLATPAESSAQPICSVRHAPRLTDARVLGHTARNNQVCSLTCPGGVGANIKADRDGSHLGWKFPQPPASKVALEHSPQNSAASHATATRAARARPL